MLSTPPVTFGSEGDKQPTGTVTFGEGSDVGVQSNPPVPVTLGGCETQQFFAATSTKLVHKPIFFFLLFVDKKHLPLGLTEHTFHHNFLKNYDFQSPRYH